MTWQTVTYRWTGKSPLIMHNGQLADPLNKWSKAIKKITSKKDKTEADFLELGRLEFFGGIYINDNGPIIPAKCIRASLWHAAKRRKEGMVLKRGPFIVEDHAIVEYEGPRTVEELFALEQHVHVAMAGVNRGKIRRTRPIFPDWEANVTVSFDDVNVDPEQVDEWMVIAGQQIGVIERRGEGYGRFTVEKLNGQQ